MRILFTCSPEQSHLRTLVPIAQAARRAGNAAAICTAVRLGATVSRYGLPHVGVPIDQAFGSGGFAFPGKQPGNEILDLISDRRFRLETAAARASSNWTTAAAKEILDRIRQWRPDIVVRESSDFSGFLAAEAAGVPHLSVAVGCSPASLLNGPILTMALNRHRQVLGIGEEMSEERLYRYRHIVLMPREYTRDEADWPSTSRTYRHADALKIGERLPEWVKSISPAEPLVLASLGTRSHLIHGRAYVARLLKAVYSGLERLDCQSVLVAPAWAECPKRPSTKVRVVPEVSQPLLLKCCDLFLTHGGFGGVREAVSSGVPMLIIPLTEDGPENAARCEALTLATTARPDSASSGTVSSRCDALLNDSRVRAASAAMQRAVYSTEPSEAVVHDLEEIVRARTAS